MWKPYMERCAKYGGHKYSMNLATLPPTSRGALLRLQAGDVERAAARAAAGHEFAARGEARTAEERRNAINLGQTTMLRPPAGGARTYRGRRNCVRLRGGRLAVGFAAPPFGRPAPAHGATGCIVGRLLALLAAPAPLARQPFGAFVVAIIAAVIEGRGGGWGGRWQQEVMLFCWRSRPRAV